MSSNQLQSHESTRPAPFSIDEQTARAVRQNALIAGVPFLALMLGVVVFTVASYFSGGLANAVITAVVLFVLAMIANAVFVFVISKPLDAIRFGGRVKAIVDTIPQLGMTPSLLHTWRSPTPGAAAVDSERGLVFVQSAETEHARYVLRADQIGVAKVTVSSVLHTHTKQRGRFHLGAGGVAYSLRGKSKSTTTQVDHAFLELHFERAQSLGSVAIPFGQDRRAADSMAFAISRMRA